MQCVDYTRNMCSVLKKSRNNDEIRKNFLNKSINSRTTSMFRGRRGSDPMVFGFTTTYAISAYQH